MSEHGQAEGVTESPDFVGSLEKLPGDELFVAIRDHNYSPEEVETVSRFIAAQPKEMELTRLITVPSYRGVARNHRDALWVAFAHATSSQGYESAAFDALIEIENLHIRRSTGFFVIKSPA